METLSSRAPWLTIASSIIPNPSPLFTPFFPRGRQNLSLCPCWFSPVLSTVRLDY